MIQSLSAIWRQKEIPVIYKTKDCVLMKMPFDSNNRIIALSISGNKLSWHPNYKCWEISKGRFLLAVQQMLFHWGSTYVIQKFNKMEKCAPACWNAKGIDCKCSCMGEHHGSGSPDGRWYEISETCAIGWRGEEFSCRLLTKRR
jgi:hypothetical protein